jgi:hypothetical protein
MVLIYACGGTSIQIAALQAPSSRIDFCKWKRDHHRLRGRQRRRLANRLIFNDANN